MLSGVSFDLALLPEKLRFDGIQDLGDDMPRYLQFTEVDESSPSYGASFYVDARAAVLDAVLARRELKRKQFAGEAPLD